MAIHWSSYVGMATGVLGALAGTAGAIMGFVAYRRSNDLKTADRRLDIRKLTNEARATVEDVSDCMVRALQSRKGVSNAAGMRQSGRMQLFLDEHKADEGTLGELKAKLPRQETKWTDLDLVTIENLYIEVDHTRRQMYALKEKYKRTLAEDEIMRQQIRDSHRR